jgi:hypothetical protein
MIPKSGDRFPAFAKRARFGGRSKVEQDHALVKGLNAWLCVG